MLRRWSTFSEGLLRAGLDGRDVAGGLLKAVGDALRAVETPGGARDPRAVAPGEPFGAGLDEEK